jgi:thiopeptide-type bacteriocin biosynthesis protein
MAERRPEWLYYRVQVDPAGAGDPLLCSVVQPVMQRLRAEVQELRWFYLRFLDATGLHVRWRLSAGRTALNHVERVVDEALAGAYTKSVYEPETHKFGDMAAAEQLFQLSSETALDLLSTGSGGNRAALAAALMLALVEGLPREQRLSFLHQYSWYWSGGPAKRSWSPVPSTARTRAKADGLRAAADSVLASPSGEVINSFSRRFWATAREATGRTDYFQLFHHLHLADNRLGVFPPAEAMIARLLVVSTPRPAGSDRMTVVTRAGWEM